ncbi:MAG: dTMP kinase [Actinomycetia bacterium]|nr:dTMP kinase [Actinomycetes bacterium]
MSGALIVLEGGEGSGKSTQVARLAARLERAGHEAVSTFEPGDSELGGSIRGLLLDDTDEPVAPMAEALLMAADRAQHIEVVVRPALERGAYVVSDRFVPSSLVYQGVARGLGVDAVEAINTRATGGLEAAVVVVLDVSEAVAAARVPDARDRMERAGRAFHVRVREAYRELAGPRGWVVVDGSQDADAVEEAVWAAVAPFVDAGSA